MVRRNGLCNESKTIFRRSVWCPTNFRFHSSLSLTQYWCIKPTWNHVSKIQLIGGAGEVAHQLKHWLLLQRVWVWFSSPTRWIITASNFCSRGSDALVRPLWARYARDIHKDKEMHACTHTYTHTFFKNTPWRHFSRDEAQTSHTEWCHHIKGEAKTHQSRNKFKWC